MNVNSGMVLLYAVMLAVPIALIWRIRVVQKKTEINRSIKFASELIASASIFAGILLLSLHLSPSDLPDLDEETMHNLNELTLKQSMLEGINKIGKVETTNYLPNNWLGRSETAAVYYPMLRIIVMEQGAPASTLAHEIGHHVWFFYLTKEERDAYEPIFNDGENPTEYAKKSKEEDFAESFELYSINRASMLNDVRLEFIRNTYDKFN